MPGHIGGMRTEEKNDMEKRNCRSVYRRKRFSRIVQFWSIETGGVSIKADNRGMNRKRGGLPKDNSPRFRVFRDNRSSGLTA